MKYIFLSFIFSLILAPALSQPANDNFASAIDVSGIINLCSADAAYTTVGATSDLSVGTCWNTGGGGNVWFSFIATTTEIHVDIKTGGVQGSQRYVYGAVWATNGTTQLACQRYFNGANDDIEMDVAGLSIGVKYYISVDNHNGSGGAYEGTFTLCLSDAAGYDLYVGAQVLSDLSSWCSADAAYTTINATADMNTGSCWNTSVNSNRWFTFVATTSGIKADIKTGVSEGTARYMYASLWESDGTTELACAKYFSGAYDDLELSAVGLTPGNTYYISVDDHNGASGAYKGTFTLCIDDAVDYDFLEGAQVLADLNSWCSADAAYTTIGATADRNTGSCWNTSVNSNRWFTFIATTAGIKADIKTGGSEGTARYMYASLWESDGTTELACAKYFSGANDDLELNAVGLTPGNTYYISVDDHSGAGGAYKGTFTLCIDDAVDYDYLEGAQVLADLSSWCSADAAYTTIGATADRNTGFCWNTSVNSNRWFTFVATTSQIKADIKTGGSEGTARYMYASLWESDGTTELACSEYFSSAYDDLELSAVGLTPGNTYYISVDDHNGAGGAYKGTFTLCLDDAVDYDYLEGAEVLSDLSNWCSADAAYTTIGATADRNTGSCWNTSVNSNRWFTFVATTTAIKSDIKTGGSEGSARYMYASLWESDGTTELACTEYFSSAYDDLELSAVGLTPGNTYYISIDDHNGAGGAYKGTFTLCIDDNVGYDFYEGAILLADLTNWCSSSAAYTTIGATADKNTGSCWNTPVNSNRWFKFVATTNEIEVEVNTGGSEGTARYMYVSLWESDGTTEVSCAKYFSSAYDDLELTALGLTIGNTYYISIDDHNGAGGAYKGTFTLCVNDKVTYDFYEKAEELTDLNAWCSANAAYTTIGATADKNTGSCWNTAVFSNRWFKFTAISPTVTYDVKTNGVEGTARYLYTSLWESDGTTELACDKYASANTDLSITYGSLTAGNTYYISVDNHSGAGGAYRGSFTLCIDNTDENYYSIVSGTWNDGNNWSYTSGGAAAGDYPQDGDVANIEDADMTLNSAISVAEVNIDIFTAATSLTIDGANLNVTGQFNVTNAGNDFDGSVSLINGGSLTVLDNLTVRRDGGANAFDFLVDDGSVTVNKSWTCDINGASTVNSTMTINNASSVSITKNLILDYSGGTKLFIQYNNSSTLSVLQDIEFIATGDDLVEMEMNNTSQLNIGGDFIRGTPAYGILDCNGSSVVNYNSTTNLQTMAEDAGSGSGDTFSYQNVTINNTRITIPQVSLEGPVSIPGTLTLTDGVLATTSSNLLTLASGSVLSGGSAASYIDGPVKKIGNTDFTFQTGDGNIWAPVGIANLTGDAATEFTTQYFYATPINPHTFKSPDPNGDLYNISGAEYWDVSNTGTASDADLTLHWKDQSRSDIDNYPDLQIAHYDGSEWENLGQSSIVGADPGSITVNGVSSFTPFTFGSQSVTFNPLPVELVSFEARVSSNSIELVWTTATEINNDYFELQKSSNGISFFAIARINGKGTSELINSYSFTDFEVNSGIQYYRLKQVDYDGSYKYSKIISANFDGPRSLRVFPNPLAGNELHITGSGDPDSIKKILITDINGKFVEEPSVQIRQNELNISGHLKKGIYILIIQTPEKTYRKKIIKL